MTLIDGVWYTCGVERGYMLGWAEPWGMGSMNSYPGAKSGDRKRLRCGAAAIARSGDHCRAFWRLPSAD